MRKRELASAVAHYIAGVLDRESMIASVDSLCASAALSPGHDRKVMYTGASYHRGHRMKKLVKDCSDQICGGAKDESVKKTPEN